jgi:serine/threonine protein kinase
LTKEYLGAGSFGEVYKAMNIVNNEMAAVKVITCHDF